MSYRNGKPRITLQTMGKGISVLISVGNTGSLNSQELYQGPSKEDAYRSAIKYALANEHNEIEVYPQSVIITAKEEDLLEKESQGRLRVVYHA